jgi:ribonuclease BN (tRNA processing enzyme)
LGIRLRCAFPNLVVEAFSATTILHVSQRLAGERSPTPEVRGRSASYTPEEVDVVLATHFHSDHVGGLTTQDGKRVFPNAEIYVGKDESDFWLLPEIAAKTPKNTQPFFQSAQAIAAPYIKVGK